MVKLILICRLRHIIPNEKTKIMNKTRLSNQIYENKGVYGDEENFLQGTSNRLEKMIKIVKNLKHTPENILDVGCGTGYFAHLTRSIYPNAKVYGVDISNTALSIGRRKYKDIIFVKADAEVKLPFKDNTFDLVISGEHIEHVRDIDQNLLEINRVTKKGGVMILTTPNLGSWLNRILLLLGKQPYFLDASLTKTLPIFKIGNYTFPEKLDYPSSGHLRLYTLDMLQKLLQTYGFKTVEAQGRMMLQKIFLKQIDQFFSHIPMLALGLIVKTEKVENL